MRVILFCNLQYAFAILKPLAKELKKRDFEYIWYVPKKLQEFFPFYLEPYTTSIKDLKRFNSDAIFVPGNDLPWYLRGVKVQIFHGLAGEKKGHFRIRDYFDLYLTQGPYFTQRFKELSKKHKNFLVAETGWSKLDPLFNVSKDVKDKKELYLKRSNAKKIILYAPTFSPSLTSANLLFEDILKLTQNEDILILIKFHDKMDKKIVNRYSKIKSKRLIIVNEDDITPNLQIADIMISDTSSVVYEFLLLNKPVITLNSQSKHIYWENIKDHNLLQEKIKLLINNTDLYKEKRYKIIELYHPYNDGKSTARMLDATKRYIQEYGVPKKRKIPLHRKIKMIKKYGL